ncbi:MAG: alpha/beta hydrolase [Gemmatimonadetes bacterium]|nr:alpha/beta hydrolase [Acidobacteriota bacterium]MDE3262721.1 alpha/beta hydrolase [Acidobacteriota bacterium]MYA10445.1 alpha/beta hydrolase [Gemmatimonadota bacterium]MYE70764.1 alpha/beta hydrolase [Gemmatimonadota bacterium]MYJ67397.1 alpha/beta hydrolase [Gemmatimonadota bacterium]
MTPTSDRFVLPEQVETVEIPLASGVASVVRRHGNPDGARLLVSHGNGLATDAYFPYWSLFLEDLEVVAFDCRNHGHNPLGPQGEHNPRVFAEDLDHAILPGVQEVFGEKPTVGCFHSLSALVGLLLPSRGAEFSGLVLFDPPIYRPGIPQQVFEEHLEAAAHMARIRATHFATVDDYVDTCAMSPLLAGVDRANLRLMAEAVLRPCADGPGYSLRCPPAYEAQAQEFIAAYAVLVDIEAMRCPVKVIGGDPTRTFSFLPSKHRKEMFQVDYDFVPDSTHYLQLQFPETCHDLTMQFLEGIGLV